jgi:hypothetical protein
VVRASHADICFASALGQQLGQLFNSMALWLKDDSGVPIVRLCFVFCLLPPLPLAPD